MEILEILDLSKAKMKEVRVIPGYPSPYLPEFDVLQPKYDGWFALAIGVGKGKFDIYSRGAELINTIDTDRLSNNGDVLIGEYMYGTNWAQTHYTNQFVAHDILLRRFKSYKERLAYLEDFIFGLNSKWFKVIETFPISKFESIWQKYVEQKGFEGLVAKDIHSEGLPRDVLSCKMKKIFSMDYVCVDMNEGKGRNEGKLGALVGGLFIDGKLTKVCSVGGGFTDEMRSEMWKNSHKYLGKVFEASGWTVFESGALRHPNFIRFRTDKKAKECVWK